MALKTALIHIPMEPRMKQTLEKRAKVEDLSVCAYVRKLIRKDENEQLLKEVGR